MNDRFKFRAWSDKQKRMYNWSEIIKMTSSCYALFVDNRALGEGLWYIQQSTGLKDKNDKLIYEGDVVKFKKIYKCACFTQEEEVLFKVTWEGYGFYLSQIKVIKGNSSYFTGRRLTVILEKDTYTEHQTDISLEVIGNIYKNKELLDE